MFLWMMMLPCSASGEDAQAKQIADVPPMIAPPVRTPNGVGVTPVARV